MYSKLAKTRCFWTREDGLTTRRLLAQLLLGCGHCSWCRIRGRVSTCSCSSGSWKIWWSARRWSGAHRGADRVSNAERELRTYRRRLGFDCSKPILKCPKPCKIGEEVLRNYGQSRSFCTGAATIFRVVLVRPEYLTSQFWQFNNTTVGSFYEIAYGQR